MAPAEHWPAQKRRTCRSSLTMTRCSFGTQPPTGSKVTTEARPPSPRCGRRRGSTIRYPFRSRAGRIGRLPRQTVGPRGRPIPIAWLHTMGLYRIKRMRAKAGRDQPTRRNRFNHPLRPKAVWTQSADRSPVRSLRWPGGQSPLRQRHASSRGARSHVGLDWPAGPGCF